MKSFRLDEPLAMRLKEAAAIYGAPESQIIREAIQEHCNRLLEPKTHHGLEDLIGSISGGGGRARNAGKLYATLLAEDEKEKREKQMEEEKIEE